MQEGLSSWFPKGHLNLVHEKSLLRETVFHLMGVEKLEARAKSKAFLLCSGLSPPTAGRGRAVEELRFAHSYPFQLPHSPGIYPQMPRDTDMSQP